MHHSIFQYVHLQIGKHFRIDSLRTAVCFNSHILIHSSHLKLHDEAVNKSYEFLGISALSLRLSQQVINYFLLDIQRLVAQNSFSASLLSHLCAILSKQMGAHSHLDHRVSRCRYFRSKFIIRTYHGWTCSSRGCIAGYYIDARQNHELRCFRNIRLESMFSRDIDDVRYSQYIHFSLQY